MPMGKGRICRDIGTGVVINEPPVSLRDWFAVRASEADIETHRTAVWQDGQYLGQTSREVAKYAYADAMMAARTQEDDRNG